MRFRTKLQQFNAIFSNSIVRITIVTSVFAFAAIKGPYWHQEYLMSTISPNVVRLVRPSNHKTGGTGFSVQAASGLSYTITNRHVCELAENNIMHVNINESGRYYNLQVIEKSEETDLCLLQNLPGKQGLKLAWEVTDNEDIAVIGHPLLMPLVLSRGRTGVETTIQLLFRFNVSEDECKGDAMHIEEAPPLYRLQGIYNACVFTLHAMPTNAIIYPGNSGSPMVNFYGNIVGVIFAADNRTNWGYAVTLDDLTEFLSKY